MKKRNGEAARINTFFKQYKERIIAPQATIIDAFIEVADDLLSLPLQKKHCSYSVFTKTIHLHVPGAVKSEILLHKKEILTHLQGRLGVKSAPKEII